RHTWQLALLLTDLQFQPQVFEVCVPVEMVDQRKSWVFAVIIDAGDIDEVVEPEVCFGEGANLGNSPRHENLAGHLATKLHWIRKRIAKLGFELLREVQSVHFRFEM